MQNAAEMSTLPRNSPNRTQQMILSHPLLHRNIAEHPVPYPLVSTQVGQTNAVSLPSQIGTHFNKFLEQGWQHLP